MDPVNTPVYGSGMTDRLTLSRRENAVAVAPGETAFSRLDNVNLSVIPEPGTYALIAGMLGLTSVMLRRRR